MTDLNPDGPHSPDRTREAGDLFDACSKFLTYATMGRAPGLEYPADTYALAADLYSATGRFPQMCEQLGQFILAQAATGRLYEAQGRDITAQAGRALAHLGQAADAARALTRALQSFQADIAGLGVKGDGNAQD
jgi:hypothetical protein